VNTLGTLMMSVNLQYNMHNPNNLSHGQQPKVQGKLFASRDNPRKQVSQTGHYTI